MAICTESIGESKSPQCLRDEIKIRNKMIKMYFYIFFIKYDNFISFKQKKTILI